MPLVFRGSLDPPSRFPSVKFGPKPGSVDGWVCTMTNVPAVKFFASSDLSQGGPFPIECVRIDRPVNTSWRTWLSWFKLLQYLDG